MFLARLIFGIAAAFAGAELIQTLTNGSVYVWGCAYISIGATFSYVDTLVTRKD
jgi:hypothetical protein